MDNTKATATNIRRIEQMRQCPRFDKCNAPICPLDSEWLKCSLKNRDQVCFFQTESVKTDAKATFEKRGLGWLLDLIGEPSEQHNGGQGG
ncbi:MAG: hypothetical protein KAX66_00185 [Propionivibrio sp.]|nr:hypothetical protein [Propionivibrio sp.]